jgi:penicillin-binding protein 2
MRRLPGGVEAAAKTGTAQVVALEKDPPKDDDEIPIERRDHAWFVTWVPADEPRIVVAVLVEHGGHGGSVAAPIAREVVVAFLEREQREAERLAAGAADAEALAAAAPAPGAGEVVLAGD